MIENSLLIEAGALALFSLVIIGALGRLAFRGNQPSLVERLSPNTTHVAKSQCPFPAADVTRPAVS